MKLIYLFSASERSKGKIFAFKDHSSLDEKSDIVWNAFQTMPGSSTAKFDRSRKIKANRELMLQKLQKISELPGMEMYEPVDRDQFPKSYHRFRAFVNQSANPNLSKTKEVMVDWNLPVKLKLILLPDQLT